MFPEEALETVDPRQQMLYIPIGMYDVILLK
jgi:hypothetical protein